MAEPGKLYHSYFAASSREAAASTLSKFGPELLQKFIELVEAALLRAYLQGDPATWREIILKGIAEVAEPGDYSAELRQATNCLWTLTCVKQSEGLLAEHLLKLRERIKNRRGDP